MSGRFMSCCDCATDQASVNSIEDAVVLHLTHQSSVYQYDEVHVPCLAQSLTQLTLAHAPMLLPVPMDRSRFRSSAACRPS